MRAVTTFMLLVTLSGLAVAETPREHHKRLRTSHGPVHLWSPAGYDWQTAALVIYVHGYCDDVDYAWVTHRLAAQFRASGLNALFIAPEAPTSDRESVSWSSLSELLDLVSANEPMPGGRVVAIAHSGGWRTVAGWLAEPRLDTIALIDAGYGDLTAYSNWLSRRPDRRLLDVGDLMKERTDAFHERLPQTVVIERFPPAHSGSLPEPAREAQVVYVRSTMGHMELVTSGIAIPMILRALSAPLVSDAERTAPLPM
jgi:hypothetical protein